MCARGIPSPAVVLFSPFILSLSRARRCTRFRLYLHTRRASGASNKTSVQLTIPVCHFSSLYVSRSRSAFHPAQSRRPLIVREDAPMIVSSKRTQRGQRSRYFHLLFLFSLSFLLRGKNCDNETAFFSSRDAKTRGPKIGARGNARLLLFSLGNFASPCTT